MIHGKKITKAAVVVAHPDDECLWYGGTVATNPDVEWHIVCVTDGGEGRQGQTRREEFESACAALGVTSANLMGLPDRWRRHIDVREMVVMLARAVPDDIDVVLTHSQGDIHHHHREVLIACCLAYSCERVRMFSPLRSLSPESCKGKVRLLREKYPSQVWSEELLLRYPWSMEGAASAGLLAFGSVPVRAGMVAEMLWNGLDASGVVTCGVPVQVRIQTRKSDLDSGGVHVATRTSAADAILSEAVCCINKGFAQGRHSHLPGTAMVLAQLRWLNSQGALFVCRASNCDGNETTTFWATDGDRMHLVFSALTLDTHYVEQLMSRAAAAGAKELWMPVATCGEYIDAMVGQAGIELGVWPWLKGPDCSELWSRL